LFFLHPLTSGCECLECEGGPPCRTSWALRCTRFNTSNCGLRYSKSNQAGFCPIEAPARFPDLFSVPQHDRRNRTYRPHVPLHVVARNESFARQLAAHMVPPVDYADLFGPGGKMDAVVAAVAGLAPGNARDIPAVAVELASRLSDLRPLLAAPDMSVGAYFFLDPAWLATGADPALVYFLTRDCPAFLAQAQAYVLARPDFAPLLSSGGNTTQGERIALQLGNYTRFGCVEAKGVAASGPAEVNAVTYCSFREAR
jgi:hypothetical protein